MNSILAPLAALLQRRLTVIAMLLALLCPAAFAQTDPPGRVAALSHMEGSVAFAAAGESEWTILRHHVLRLIAIPLVTVFGLELGSTLAFAVVTETIFSWPGVGKLIIDSISVLDRPVMVAYLMLVAMLFITINLTVDIAYAALDPRLRARKSS